jgi:nicotinamide-nucleotide adenylyltransferase
MIYKYKCGLYIGRFQPIHIGHTSIIAKMLIECEKVIVVVGSTQESGTVRNPFSFAERKIFIEQCFRHCLDRMIIVPVPDREKVDNDAGWGDYVFDKIKEFCGLVPTVIYEGIEEERSNWYDHLKVEVARVSRTIIPMSATIVREGLRTNDEEIITNYLPYGVREMAGFMRERIKSINENKN